MVTQLLAKLIGKIDCGKICQIIAINPRRNALLFKTSLQINSVLFAALR
jgi:hypothetical protein